MLTLTNALTIDGATVYQDDANQLAIFEQGIADQPTWKINDDGTVSQMPGHGLPTGADTTPAAKYYLLPENPEIVKGPDGAALFSLIIYRHDEARVADPSKDVGGGILTFTTELISDKFNQVKAALNRQAGATGGTDSVELDYVQFIDGTITVSVAGEDGSASPGAGEFVTSIIGNGKLGGVGANQHAVMVKLTQDGASLLSSLDKVKTLPINIQYNLRFEHRLLGVKMIAFCDIGSSYVLIQSLRTQDPEYNDGYLGFSHNHQDDRIVTKVTEALVRSKNMYVTVIPATSEVDQDTLTALEKEGSDILNKEVAGVLEAGPPPSSLDRNQLTQFEQTYNSSLNYTIDRRMVLVSTFTPSANLQNLLVGANLADLVAFVDLRTAFFTFLQIPIRVNADFGRLPLDSVTVTVTYNRKAFDGSGNQQVRGSFNFTSGTQVEHFLAYANSLDEVSYDWSAEVHYQGSDVTFTMAQHGVKDNFLVVDVGQLGMLSTEFALGLADQATYPIAVVSARYQSAALGREISTQLRLDKDTASLPWTAVIQEQPVNGFQYKVDWLHQQPRDASGTQPPPEIESGNWTTSHDSRVEINAPLGQQMTVSVFCSGNFSEGPDKLSQVAAALHYEDAANHHVVDGEVTFTDDKQQQTWVVDLIDPSVRDYTYRYTNVYEGGVVKTFPEDGSWAKGDPGYITVGEKYSMTVTVYPLLLMFDGQFLAAEVDLDYQDAAGKVSLTDTLVFSASSNTTQTWRVRGRQGGPTTWGYRVTYFYADGTRVQGDHMTQDSDALLVPPPARTLTPGPAGHAPVSPGGVGT